MLRADIAKLAGNSVRDLRPFAAGHTADLYLADMADGSRMVIKRARDQSTRMDIEGWMLKYLRQNSKLPVPDVICMDPGVLMMSYIPDTGRMNGFVEADAARHLAALHGLKESRYGLERDTMFGPFLQVNKQSRDWCAFFRDRRLMPMAMSALAETRITPDQMAKIETLAGKLDQWIVAPSLPGLIHGDVWGRNILTVSDHVKAFIDPAIYYADPEIELAFIALFSTFGDRFFGYYNEIRPIGAGFYEARRDIYMLYPLLAHARIYGGKYVERAMEIVDRFVGG